MVFALPNDTVLIGDGGLATALETRGHDLSDDLWSARLLIDAPDEIVAVHSAFFRAGAAFATTASYQASFDGFAARGIDRAHATRLLQRSVELAKTARDESGGHRYVAASVGPYGAALANGEEYVGRYGLSVAQLAAWHRPRLEVLVDAGPDILAVETVPDADEAEALVGLIHECKTPAWLSYTIDGLTTRAGQPLTDAFAVAADVPEIVAVGVNCCAPDDVLTAVEIARTVTGKPVIVYPNSGETWDGPRRTWVGDSKWSAHLAPQWVAAGACIVGGCCRVGPSDIAALAATVTSPNVP
ncbi:homocysteine S-methyltransferase [Mycolicibacterium moriokaense]|uniref:Homocysteine S-methyltransferase n=1 Tax=Mycolicibacterium moriokaense TaxID=39691 RepID=A0AAD1HB94_9MYCO|nr:homocysteine S-methyltransferase [Mycolicibacterium moriokaense]MCV7039922.1 homocysteine S-methyltransferase [Mycolicibacterium moriokaense]ORB25759.1 homocysteine S-methyltransferase [Mycolicibacterium moriokaense]BBX01625.1 homocysteine S-methyltransferase [Mycolicibacterium moriokaense]